MLLVHRVLGTWQEKVTRYVVLTHFMKNKLSEAGLPEERITVKPNFVHPDPGQGSHEGSFALFVGRLSPEKGLETLLEGWRQLRHPIPLKVVGAGPLLGSLEKWIRDRSIPSVDLVGGVPRVRVVQMMREARFLVFPSEWYEGLPLTLLEAFACGLPVVASRLGAMREVVEEGVNGTLFNPGDPEDLGKKIEALIAKPDKLKAMSREARRAFEEKYCEDTNYRQMIEIYDEALTES
jgi:glycosyltransferase involved in cell wall biosynthesis